MTKAMATPSKLAQILRDTMIPLVSHLAPLQHAFVQRLSELGIAYSGSPIVEGPGKRYFDDSLRGGDGIRSRFLLIIDKNADSSVKDAARQLSESFPDTIELRFEPEHELTLLRPDGYVACSTHSGNEISGLKNVRELLERQTTSSR
jgi:hypothetical protein